jgi:pimeloyl-ACP methyl ester carboxylesterase
MKELTDYWVNDFNWRKVEAEVNAYPNFIAPIKGYKIHFIHVKGKGAVSVPLILSHGWPGSFLEFMKLIPMLTEPTDFSFDVVIPSLLGFGLSQKPIAPGCNVHFMADIWVELIAQLGYSTFIAQGGDFGAGICTALGLRHADHLLGLHLNYIPGSYRTYTPEDQLTEQEKTFLKQANCWYEKEGGYAHQQRTKPLTLAYGLSDSPVGLCAWLAEKMICWAATPNALTKEEILANVTLYWLTETIYSSTRLYNESSKVPFHFTEADFVKVPVGIAHFPYEEPFPPRRYIERGYNIVHWAEMPAGGHFAALEQPSLLAEDLLHFGAQLIGDNNSM